MGGRRQSSRRGESWIPFGAVLIIVVFAKAVSDGEPIFALGVALAFLSLCAHYLYVRGGDVGMGSKSIPVQSGEDDRRFRVGGDTLFILGMAVMLVAIIFG